MTHPTVRVVFALVGDGAINRDNVVQHANTPVMEVAGSNPATVPK